MIFYGNWRAAAIWVGLSLLQIGVSAARYIHHNRHDGFAAFQLCSWLFILIVWCSIGSTRWRFRANVLEQYRIGARVRSVPYDAILSVDPVSQAVRSNQSVIVYGSTMFAQATQRLVVNPADLHGFMTELEHHAPQATFNV